MYVIKQSTAITVPFFAHDASGDAVTALTDGSFTKRISKNGGAFAAMTVTITELENGWYSIPLSASHSDTLGILSVVFTNAGAKQVNLQWRVEANLADDLATDIATVDTVVDAILVDTNELQTDDVPGLIAALNDPTVAAIADAVWDEAYSGHNTNGTFGKVLKQIGEGWVADEGAVNDGSPTTTSFITNLTNATTSFFSDAPLMFTSGALAGQSRIITSYNGTTKAVTFDEAFTSAPANSDTFIILAQHVHPVTDIAIGVWDALQSAHTDAGSFGEIATEIAAILVDTADMQPKLGAPAADVSADIAAVKAETALIVADTNELQTDNVPGLIATAQSDLDIITGADGANLLTATQASIDAIEVDTGTTLQAELDGIQADTENIQSRLPAALTAGSNMKSDALAINGDTTAAANLAKSGLAIQPGLCEGTPTTTVIQTDLAEATDDHYIGRVVVFTSGNAAGQASDITDYTGSTGTITVTAMTTAPAATDAFVIV